MFDIATGKFCLGCVAAAGQHCLEAMSCGLPVLVADSPASAAARLVLGPEFLFTTGDAADLAKHIDYHIEHRTDLARARERTHQAAQAYGFDASVARLVSVYRHVVHPAQMATGGPAVASG